MGADAIYCPLSSKSIKIIADEGTPVAGHTDFVLYESLT